MRKAFLLVAALAIAQCSLAQYPRSFVDKRDGSKYTTVVLGDQEWMTMNLTFEPDSEYFMPEGNIRGSGLLYTYETACKVCPEGWSLPTEEDWMKVVKFIHYAGMSSPTHGRPSSAKGSFVPTSLSDLTGVAYAFKADSVWINGFEGSNEANFNALPTGWREPNGVYAGWGEAAQWWTRSISDPLDEAWSRGFHGKNPFLQRFENDINSGLAVRCWRHPTIKEDGFLSTPEIELAPEDVPFMIVEHMPAIGHCKTLRGDKRHQCTQMEIIKFVSANTVYPPEVKPEKLSGTVFVYFVVDKQGHVSDARILRPVHPLLDAEALRVIRSLPTFEPGKQRDTNVAVQYTIPIKYTFRK